MKQGDCQYELEAVSIPATRQTTPTSATGSSFLSELAILNDDDDPYAQNRRRASTSVMCYLVRVGQERLASGRYVVPQLHTSSYLPIFPSHYQHRLDWI